MRNEKILLMSLVVLLIITMMQSAEIVTLKNEMAILQSGCTQK